MDIENIEKMEKEKGKEFILTNYKPMTRKNITENLLGTLFAILYGMFAWSGLGPFRLNLLFLICFFAYLIWSYSLPQRKEYPIQIKFLHTGICCSLVTMASLFVFLAGLTYNNWSVYLFIFVLLLILGNLALTMRMLKRRCFRTDVHTNTNKRTSSQTQNPLLFSLSACAGGLGMMFARTFLAGLSQNVIHMIVLVMLVALALFFSYMSVGYYYKLYILWRYCPELRDKV